MYRSEYMFVNHRNRTFPVSVSVQNGRENLVILHFHEEVEILKVNRGIVQIHVGNANIKCSESDILLFPPNTLHQVTSETKNAEIVAITFKEDLINIPLEWSLTKGGFRLFNSNGIYYKELNSTFSKALDLFRTPGITYEIEMTACLLIFASIFIKDEIVVTHNHNHAQNRLLPVLEYIRENIDSPIKIADLTEILFISKEHLIRLFKSATGKTPLEYITDSKIQKAMTMLEENRYSVSEISEKLAFANPSYFSKIFKQKLKMSPSEYRKRKQKNTSHV